MERRKNLLRIFSKLFFLHINRSGDRNWIWIHFGAHYKRDSICARRQLNIAILLSSPWVEFSCCSESVEIASLRCDFHLWTLIVSSTTCASSWNLRGVQKGHKKKFNFNSPIALSRITGDDIKHANWDPISIELNFSMPRGAQLCVKLVCCLFQFEILITRFWTWTNVCLAMQTFFVFITVLLLLRLLGNKTLVRGNFLVRKIPLWCKMRSNFLETTNSAAVRSYGCKTDFYS